MFIFMLSVLGGLCIMVMGAILMGFAMDSESYFLEFGVVLSIFIIVLGTFMILFGFYYIN